MEILVNLIMLFCVVAFFVLVYGFKRLNEEKKREKIRVLEEFCDNVNEKNKKFSESEQFKSLSKEKILLLALNTVMLEEKAFSRFEEF